MATRARILVVDEHAQARQMAELLDAAGFEAVTADSAEEAIFLAANAPPDLAVLDVHMPKLSGFELAKVLRDQFSIPFVFLTLVDDDSTVHAASEVGALAYLCKSGDVQHHLPALKTAVALAQEVRKLRKRDAGLSEALEERREISIAIGILIERHRLSRDASFEMLRNHARGRRQRVQEVAIELLNSVERLNDLSAVPAKRVQGC